MALIEVRNENISLKKHPKICLFHTIHKHCYCPHLCMIVEYDRLSGVGVILCLMSLSGEFDYYLFSCFLIYWNKDYISCLKWLISAVL